MTHGGSRRGAGRKKGSISANTLKAQEAKRILIEMVEAEIRPIGSALIAKAKNGDVAAARELLDRAWGKSISSAVIYGEVSQELEQQRENVRALMREIHKS